MLLNQWIRVFFSDNGTVSDLSVGLQRNSSVSLPFVAADDKLYIAQTLPFNNFFLEMATANDQASTLSIDLWNGLEWKAAVDILDSTASSGASLGQDGVVQFSPDRDEFWDCVEDTRDEPTAFGLQSDIVLYDSYFARISFSADLNVSTGIKKIGYLFATDEQLQAIDPEIDNYLTSWESGKTDWVEQILIASQHVIIDMNARGWIIHPGQILRMDDVSLATAYRTLVLIYNKLGPGFDPQRDNALKQYNDLMSTRRRTLDINQDGEVDRHEFASSVAKGIR